MNWAEVADWARVVACAASALGLMIVVMEAAFGYSLACAFRGHQWVQWQVKPDAAFYRQCCWCARRQKRWCVGETWDDVWPELEPLPTSFEEAVARRQKPSVELIAADHDTEAAFEAGDGQ